MSLSNRMPDVDKTMFSSQQSRSDGAVPDDFPARLSGREFPRGRTVGACCSSCPRAGQQSQPTDSAQQTLWPALQVKAASTLSNSPSLVSLCLSLAALTPYSPLSHRLFTRHASPRPSPGFTSLRSSIQYGAGCPSNHPGTPPTHSSNRRHRQRSGTPGGSVCLCAEEQLDKGGDCRDIQHSVDGAGLCCRE